MKHVFDLSQPDWHLTGYTPYLWRFVSTPGIGDTSSADIEPVSARVPGSVQQSLLDAGILPDWNQGLEFYTAARRLGKEVILLSYPDEPHHLGKIENQKDFQTRMKQYFDHYLMDKPAPDWMVNGIPFLKKKGGN